MNVKDIRKFKVAVITVSDIAYQGVYKDETGPMVVDVFDPEVFDVHIQTVVPDNEQSIVDELLRCTDIEKMDIVITVGGSGCSSRDVTPEATAKVLDKELSGVSEAIREETRKRYPKMLFSRGLSGLRKNTFILNLPGNPENAKSAIECVVGSIPLCLKTIQKQKPRKKEHVRKK